MMFLGACSAVLLPPAPPLLAELPAPLPPPFMFAFPCSVSVGLWLHSRYSLGWHHAGRGGTVQSGDPKGFGSGWTKGR